ncbi:MAG: hypothetical protein HFE74_04860 [Firmicutes bacterium]|jgi:hypothetical protein|nr:hypothetical protein [Bacillota bacterium]
MKTFGKCCLVAAIFFFGTLALLGVDRRCAMMYQEGGNISSSLQVFVEKILDLH